MTDEEYKQAESFWIRKDRETVQMPQSRIYQWLDKFLSSHKVLTLAAGNETFIRCTPLEYTWHDEAFWIFTEGGLKFRALKENAHVAAAVFEPIVSFGNLQSVQIQGTAEIVDLFSEEYISEAKYRNIPLETLKKLQEPMWLLKITPTEITCLNSSFKKDGFGSRQIWKGKHIF